MFRDLVGSTALSAALDPEDVGLPLTGDRQKPGGDQAAIATGLASFLTTLRICLSIAFPPSG
jgi:hypothetical protein